MTPSPPKPPPDQQFLGASGWEVRYSALAHGSPAENNADRVVWKLREPSEAGGERVTVGFEGFRSKDEVQAACQEFADKLRGNHKLVYQIPSAGLGHFIGAGWVFEDLKARSGQGAEQDGLFLMCSKVGDLVVAGWGQGPRRPDLEFTQHADPAFSYGAQYLAELGARVEYLDQNGNAL